MKSFLILITVVSFSASCIADDVADGPVQVFILAGQSNMEGQGVVDLDHPKYYNGGKGILKNVIKNPERAKQYSHIQDENGEWVIRHDVWCRFRVKRGVKAGPLTIGYTGYPGKHHIGPEFQFGHVIGDATKQQVLLIKTAWGGKSLYKDFRPPSAGEETGIYYNKMIAEIDEALAQLPKDFPSYKNRGYQIAGFVWFQGWNDMYGEKARTQYKDNLVHLIKDVRKAVKKPHLPVIIGELGNGGPDASKNMQLIRDAQAAAAKHKDFHYDVVSTSPSKVRTVKTVAFVKTTQFARPKKESPNVGHGHHWYGNAESYFLIGDAMGKAMLELLKK